MPYHFPAMAETPLYLSLYNARSNDELYRIFYADAGGVTRAATVLRKLFPEWADAVQQHHHTYRRCVEHWVTDQLTQQDWHVFWDWVGRDAHEFFRLVVPPPGAPRWNLTGWLITVMKTNPHEPFTEAYRQMARRMIEERLGQALRPRFCSACGRLFEPQRVTQLCCSRTCRDRISQRAARARRRAAKAPPLLHVTASIRVIQGRLYPMPVAIADVKGLREPGRARGLLGRPRTDPQGEGGGSDDEQKPSRISSTSTRLSPVFPGGAT
jgi:hypothetical protein